MLFRKEIEPRCAYCQHSNPLNENQMTCLRHGVVSPEGSCRRFSYDPLRRVPPRPVEPDFSRLRDEDFSID